MKRTLFIFVTLLFLVFPLTASAYSDGQTEELAVSSGVDELKNEFIDEDELSGDKSINVF